MSHYLRSDVRDVIYDKTKSLRGLVTEIMRHEHTKIRGKDNLIFLTRKILSEMKPRVKKMVRFQEEES